MIKLDALKMLSTLALRNLTRQRTRTAITLSAISCGVAALILAAGFVADIFDQFGEAIIHSRTGHIQIFEDGYLDEGARRPMNYLIADADKLRASVTRIPDVQSASLRLNFTGLISNGRRDLAIVGEGVEPAQESAASQLRYQSGRALDATDQYGTTVGAGVAHLLNLEPGSRVTLLMETIGGALNTVDLEVVGIFQSFSKDFDARAIQLPLTTLQELLGTHGANLMVVTLHDTTKTDAVAAALRTETIKPPLTLKVWHELSDFYSRSVELYDRQFAVLQLIILLMVLLSVINSVNMSAFERQAEFGTLQALGTTQNEIYRILLMESCFLGMAGAVMGSIIGILLAALISTIGIPMPPPPNSDIDYIARVQILPSSIFLSSIIGFFATLLAAIFPARRICRTPIADALRSGV